RSPIPSRSTTDRRLLPMRRWISIVLPLTFPFEDSRILRLSVALGNIAYSAVIQPFPCPRLNGGTFSSILALLINYVLPTWIKTDPSGCITNSVMIVIGRSSLFFRSVSFRIYHNSFIYKVYRNIFFYL